MRYIYSALIIFLSWGSTFLCKDASAQKKPNTLPYTFVFKLKQGEPNSTSSRAASTKVQGLLKQVKTQYVKQQFPKAASYSNYRSTGVKAVNLSQIYEVRYEPGQSFEQIRKQLLSTGEVEYVEPLYLHEPLYVPNDPQSDSSGGAQAYLKRIMAYSAWDVTKGDTSVVIGVLDTGIRLNHEDLKGSIKYNYNDPIDGIDNDQDGLVDNLNGWDFADNDNDPSADINGHGTSVSGFAAAQADNGKGMAGVGFRCKIMPLKVFSSGQGRFNGYEAIVYAADHGCKIINLSWGSENTYSAYEQDIINYAVLDRDVVIVAAAGNANKDVEYYPASYQHVLSVSGISEDDSFGNLTYNYAIDISAPGRNVYTTTNSSDNSYYVGSGSSYASPMVAGAAALVRSKYPSLTALQVIERLRVTADNIYNVSTNTMYNEKLGKGRLNVYKAVSQTNPKAVRVTDWKTDKDGYIYPGETVQLTASYTNYLNSAASVIVSLSSPSPYIQVVQGQYNVGAMATLGVVKQNSPFQIKIAPDVPANTTAYLRFGFTDGSYTDYQYIKLLLNPEYITTDVNNLIASFLSRGNIGYDGLNYQIGKGVTYKGSNSLLAEGGLMIGSSSTQVSDNIRNEKGTTDFDFYVVSTIQHKAKTPEANFVATGTYEDSLTSVKSVGVQIKQNVYAWKDAPNQDFVISEYTIGNHSTKTITDLYAGIFTDWDVIQANKNKTEWDAINNMGYTYHVADSSVWIGIKLLTHGSPGYYALENTSPTDGSINMSDGFTTEEKYKALSSGVSRTKAGGAAGKDVSSIVSTKLETIEPGKEQTIAFALVGGSTRAELKANAAAAQARYNHLVQDRLITGVPEESSLASTNLFPNPTTGKVSISLPVALQKAIQYEVISATGKRVLQQTTNNSQELQLDLSQQVPGVYFLRLTTEGNTVTKKFLIAR